MQVSLVVAAGEDNAIGADNRLLWKLPNDMKFFKNLTWGMVVIMGRKTFASLGYKPLPGRMNIVITRDSSLLTPTSTLRSAGSLESALEAASEADCKEVFVIGGGEIYTMSMPHAATIYLTRVHAVFPEADTFFEFPEADFFRKQHTFFAADDKHALDYTFEVWERVNPEV